MFRRKFVLFKNKIVRLFLVFCCSFFFQLIEPASDVIITPKSKWPWFEKSSLLKKRRQRKETNKKANYEASGGMQSKHWLGKRLKIALLMRREECKRSHATLVKKLTPYRPSISKGVQCRQPIFLCLFDTLYKKEYKQSGRQKKIRFCCCKFARVLISFLFSIYHISREI